MNLFRILTPVLASLFLVSTAADARYVFVYPSSGTASPTLSIYSEQLVQVGTVQVPAGTNQALTNATGDKVMLITAGSTAAVHFVTISGGQVTGALRSLNLDSQPIVSATMTPDGQRLLVLTGATPGTLYVIDPVTESILTGAKVTIGATPKDMVVTRDSKYAVTLSGTGLMTVVELASYSVVSQTAIPDVGGEVGLSVAPFGSIYVTGNYRIVEINPNDSFKEIARTAVSTYPGKIKFSPDGKYGIATNGLGSGSSLIGLDFTVRGANTPAGAQLSAVPITAGLGDTNPRKVDELFTISNTEAIAWVSQLGKMYIVKYPTLQASELSLGQIGTPLSISGVAATNEVPAVRSLYYNSNGQVFKHDLVINQPQGSATLAPALLGFSAQPSTNPAATVYGYNDGVLVGPGAKVRPYYIRALDGNGRPVFGANVSFSPETTGTLLTNAAVTTNMDGYAWVTATSPLSNGEFKVKATVGTASVVLTSTVTGGTSGGGTGGGGGTTNPNQPKLVKVSGDGQLTQLFNAFTKPLIIQALDASGKPIAGKQITFTESGGVSFASPTQQTTDANGMAQMVWVAGGSMGPGIATLTYTVVANSDIGNAVFTLNAFPYQSGQFNPTPTIQMTKPSQDAKHLTVKLGTKVEGAIKVIAVTSGGIGVSPGLPIAGVGLTVSTPNTDPSVGPVARCDGGTILSGQDGIASCDLIVEGKTGESQLSVDVGNLIAFNDLRITVQAGDPIAPVIVSGNNQTGKPGATLSAPLVVRVSDGYGNLLPGTTVSWEVVTANSVRLFNTISTADYNGLASTSVQLGANSGQFRVKAWVGGREAAFDLTVETLATGFAKVSGDNQASAPINTAFSQPLVVVLTNAQGQPVAGGNVTWTVAGPATLSATTTPSGADGRAQVTVTAGSTPGAITVTAAFQSLPSLSFALTSRLPGPSLTASSFTNYASGEAILAPGQLALIKGAGLATSVSGQVNADLLKGKLPFTLAGVTVEFRSGGVSYYAPIYRVARESGVESVLIQVPFELPVGTVSAVVTSGGSSTVNNIVVRLIAPGVLEDVISGRKAAVVIRSDGLVVSPETPARRGEEVRMYAIGLGQTSPTAETNRVGQPQQSVLATVIVGVDDKGVDTLRAELAENLIGVYEVVFKIPMDATLGADRPLGFLVDAGGDMRVFANGSLISIGAQ